MSALKLGLAAYLSTSGTGVRRLPSTIAGHNARQLFEAMDTLPAFGPSQFSIFGEEAMDTQPYTGHSQFSIFSNNDMDTAPAMGHGQFSIFAKPQSWKNVSGTFGTMNLSHILKTGH
ncbi:uncharacterized protein LOC124138479 isoform X2 [Haliotis rufescens]|uniref:uncharacterized protein LOC124138479 isoform X2 n=1 Tax=Haliotis rufescens TaxID=6454 RepID=UPI00201EF56A|nr:uncharacterized protein LOC124138479 isoform X2 [Haliotis rufescens]